MNERTAIALLVSIAMVLFIAGIAFSAWRRSPERIARQRSKAYFREERAWQARCDAARSKDRLS